MSSLIIEESFDLPVFQVFGYDDYVTLVDKNGDVLFLVKDATKLLVKEL